MAWHMSVTPAQKPPCTVVAKPEASAGTRGCLGSAGVGQREVESPISPAQDKGGAGVKEMDSLNSDRLRTVQLDVCSQEEVEKAVQTVCSSLKDPEKGGDTVGAAGEGGHPPFFIV